MGRFRSTAWLTLQSGIMTKGIIKPIPIFLAPNLYTKYLVVIMTQWYHGDWAQGSRVLICSLSGPFVSQSIRLHANFRYQCLQSCSFITFWCIGEPLKTREIGFSGTFPLIKQKKKIIPILF